MRRAALHALHALWHASLPDLVGMAGAAAGAASQGVPKACVSMWDALAAVLYCCSACRLHVASALGPRHLAQPV